MQAEEVTLQRLIDAHMQPSMGSSDKLDKQRPHVVQGMVECVTDSLPEIDLLVGGPGHRWEEVLISSQYMYVTRA